MGRDLLYKPPVPIQLPDEEEEGGQVKKTGKSGAASKHQDVRKTSASALEAQLRQKLNTQQSKGPAFKNQYFNQDVNATQQANMSTRAMSALRGAEGASDLRQVVLPGATKETPSPEELRSSSELMGLDGELATDLQGLLQRQGSFAQGKGVTVEMLEARLAQLEEMVMARKAALGRVLQAGKDVPASSSSLVQAASGAGSAENIDLAQEGNRLIQAVQQEAGDMHDRLRRTLGLKKQ
ncbi:MAG: hypothetical protein HOK28_02360 [Deltaproteobacteria bacterium]|jgi:hypothetical protein|nr:hypothetical protein [Deltaproteobacteria bacterium]